MADPGFWSDQEQAQSLIGRGAFDYVLKPFRLEVVEDSVKRALEQRLTPTRF